MKWVVLTPFNERGYWRLYEFLKIHRYRVLVPILRDLCESRVLLFNVPVSFLNIWGPVLSGIRSGEIDAECYLHRDELIYQVNKSVELTSLVLKAKVFGKVDLDEWFRVVPRGLRPRFFDWSGLLIVDRFIDYVLLIKYNVLFNRLISIDVFAPTPIDILILVFNKIVEWECSVLDVINWVVKYLGEFIVSSKNLTEAYTKLTHSNEYREFINQCLRENYMINW